MTVAAVAIARRAAVAFVCAAVFLVVFFVCAGRASASAITAPVEGRAMIEAAQASLEEKRQAVENEGYKAEAEAYIVSADEELLRAEADADEARKALEEAEIDARIAEENKRVKAKAAERAAAEADALAMQAQELLNQAAAAAKRADSLSAAAQRRDAAVSSYVEEQQEEPRVIFARPLVSDDERSLEHTDELRSKEAEMNWLERELRRAEAARREKVPHTPPPPLPPAGGDWGSVRSAYSRAAYLERNATALDARSERAQEIADDRLAEAEEAEGLAEDAQLILRDARDSLAEYEGYVEEAKSYAEQTRTERDALLATLSNPEAAKYGSAAIRYHQWSDGDARSGYQTAIPISYGKWTPKFSYGIETYYVFTDELNTLTDTSVYLSWRDERKKFILDYFLSINVPTGKSALNWHERHARWTEDLVTIEQFGKGWQFTPGVAVTWKTSEEETWTVGTGYTFSTSYDPTSDIPNDDITPGGEWGQYVRYQNAREEWQFVAELGLSLFGGTDVDDGSSYTESDEWDFKMAYNKKLNEKQDLMFYYLFERQGNNDMPFMTESPNVHYFGTMWKNKLAPDKTLRLAFDVMTTSGSRYLRTYSYYDELGNPAYGIEDVDGRDKYTFGIGYDWRINDKSSLAFDIEYFIMNDGATTLGYPATDYNGWNVYLTYFMNF